FIISLVIFAGIMASDARAGNEPIFAAAPGWVEQPQIPTADPKLSEQPFQLLLFTAQTSHSPDGSTRYFETAGKIQSAEALTASGTIAIPWQPERSDLTIHKLEIIRDGIPRDVLAKQKFSVLRRESNLEAAVLDGMLTATIQPEDLRVGDIVHLAYSTREKPGSIEWQAEDAVSIRPGTKSSLALLREIWPDSVPLRWAASPGMGQLKAHKTKLGNELRAELRNIDVSLPPQFSPARFSNPMYLEATAYRDWAELSALLAPLYAKAASLPENSPLKAEARLIATASPAPKARALAALRLVQDKIRYLALQMNEGGYIPASAEETWNRRFGDCKGKTATLVALLKELGIEAEPVLVNTVAGDALPTRLPQANLFNHVLVHAIIEGKSYWLDGTRTGHRDLEELASSGYRFALPVRAPGATLMALPLAPPLKPLIETKITYDASAGILVPANTQGEMIFRGELATVFRLTLAEIGEAEFKKRFDTKPYLPGAIDRVVRFNAEPDRGIFTVFFSGRERMGWSKNGELKSLRFQFQDSTLQWRPDFKGREGINAQVPFILNFPVYFALREEVILPAQGKGYSLQGKSFDRTVAGTRIAQSLTLENGHAVATSTFIRLQPELPAAEAPASAAALAKIGAEGAYLVAPEGLEISEWRTSREPATAQDFIARGYDRLNKRMPMEAVADFDRAIELAPDSSLAHAERALALIALARLDEAEVAISKARSLPPVDPRSLLAQGLLHARRGRPEKAIPDFSRYLLEYNQTSAMSLLERGLAYEQTGQFEKARADMESVLALEPESSALVALARVTARLGKVQEAMTIIDKATRGLDAASTPPWRKTYILGLRRGRVLGMAGRPEQARAEYEAALREVNARLKQLPVPRGPLLEGETLELLTAKVDLLAVVDRAQEAIAVADLALTEQPNNVPMLLARCKARLRASVQLGKARQDCDEARRYDPANLEAKYASGLLSLKSNDWDRAAAEFGAAIKDSRIGPKALFGFGIAKLRGHEADGGWAIERARELLPEIDAEFGELGIKPEINADAPSVNTAPGMSLFTWGSDGHPSREPVTAEDFLARGYSRLVKQQLNEALGDFDRGIGLAPESSLAYSLRANALTRLARLDEAEVAIDKALTRETVYPRAFQVRGLLRARRGRLKEAIQDLSRDLRPEAISAVWLVERGLAYEKLGEFEKARADLQQAVSLLPSIQRRLLLARVTARLGKVEEAIAIVDNAVPVGAANTPSWMKTYILALRRGSVLGMAGRKEEARAQYEAALTEVDARLQQLPAPRGPVLGGVGPLKAKIDLLVLTHRTPEAIAVADRALAVQPSNAPILTARCKAWLHAPAQLAKARQDCEAARRNDPANREALYASGLTSLMAKDWTRAAGEFQALTKELPTAPAPLFGRGIAKLRHGEKADGGADIELARSLSGEVDAEFEEIGIKP
ncbi:MAG: tetratricopeptide repeat protein, partial [Alphaproteobacteria bacterium]|nr:tetratricopeptide repeat protein [Alphaproteobacteria bacterium]